ncbi:MAG: hypothetical protein Q9165_003760 [Trypethelium subeluteriae]
MTQPPGAVSAQARLTLHEAFERFSRSVTPEERRDFSSTSLEDVRNAAIQTERQLAARRSLRNMRRLHPFLQGLERYSKSIEVLCNGTPYLPWIWAPIKLMIQVSADYLQALENLVEAYGRIADTLPRFDRLASALKADHNFQAVLAFFYADILEFHRRTYKFVRRSSWKTFFSSMWGGELIDKEAIAVNIAETTERRKEQAEQWEKDDEERCSGQLVRVLSWLRLSGTSQVDEIDRISRVCQLSSCDWISEHPKIKLWMKDSPTHALVWLHGKPGAGKSILCSNLVKSMQSRDANVFYYFFNYRESIADSSSYMLRSLVAQIIQKSPDLVAYVHDEFVSSHFEPSLKALRDLLPRILASNSHSYLVIDGIDECDSNNQKFIIDDVLQLLSTDGSSHVCKVLISTRDVPTVTRGLGRKTKLTISLSHADEHQSINNSIQYFIRTRLSQLQEDLDELDPTRVAWHDVQRILLQKADGERMFLWVALVLSSLESVYTIQELYEIVEDFPSDLSELYLMNSATSVPIQRMDSHYDITFACVATLASGLDLVGPEVAEQDRLMSVASRKHGLIPYAIEYWIEHLLLYASAGGTFEQDRPLSLHLSSFLNKHNQLFHLTKSHANEAACEDEGASYGKSDKRLGLLANLPVHDLARKILHLRWLSNQESSESGAAAETYAINHDKTLFTELAVGFNGAVLKLLTQKEVSGLTQPTLDTFKRLYASSAFRCRYPSCPDAPAGFATDELRTQHEATHLRRIFCTLAGCAYNRIGFTSRKGLSTHMRSHNDEGKIPIPSKVRRIANEGTDTSVVNDSVSGPMDKHSESNRSLSPSTRMQSEVDTILGDLKLDDVSERYKTVGEDWYCIYNPRHPRELKIWDIKTEKIHNRLVGHEQCVNSVDFARHASIIASGSDDHSLRLWIFTTGQLLMKLLMEDAINSVAISNDDRWVAAASLWKGASVWRVDTGTLRMHIGGHQLNAYSACFDPDSLALLTSGCDATIRMWDLFSHSSSEDRCVWTLKSHNHELSVTTSRSAGQPLLLSGSVEGRVQLWNSDTGRPLLFLDGHQRAGGFNKAMDAGFSKFANHASQ